jgi:hypothetical protein
MTGPSRGRKQCPACKTYVGVRSHHCSCGHDFTTNRAPQRVAKPEGRENKPVAAVPYDEPDEPMVRSALPPGIVDTGFPMVQYRVHTPKGACPVALPRPTPDAVADWAKLTYVAGRMQGRAYSANALRFWLRTANIDPDLLPAGYEELT